MSLSRMLATCYLLFLMGCGPDHWTKERCTILDKGYTPSSVGNGVGITSKGHLAVTVNSTPESWWVVKACPIEGVYGETLDLDEWSHLEKGQVVNQDHYCWFKCKKS